MAPPPHWWELEIAAAVLGNQAPRMVLAPPPCGPRRPTVFLWCREARQAELEEEEHEEAWSTPGAPNPRRHEISAHRIAKEAARDECFRRCAVCGAAHKSTVVRGTMDGRAYKERPTCDGCFARLRPWWG